MIERISDWANDETICENGRKFSRNNPDPKDHYNNCPLAHWFFFRIYHRWPELALELAAELLKTLDTSVLNEACQAALKDAVNMSLSNGALEKHLDPIRADANLNNNCEKAIFIFLRWRLGQKWRPAGPFMLVFRNYKIKCGVENADEVLLTWLKEKIPLEKWLENLEP